MKIAGYTLVMLMLVCLFQVPPAQGQDEFKVLEQDGSELLHSWLMQQANILFDKRAADVSKSLTSEENLFKRQKRLRADYRRILGYLPERTPLNPQVTGRIDHDDYRIETIPSGIYIKNISSNLYN